jgi:cardiolipin synthase
VTSSNGPSSAAPVPPTDATPALHTPPVVDRAVLPDRVWTLPNALSVLRLLGVPLFLWLLLGPQADGWALVVLVVSGFTDWLDGKLARWLDQSSRLGALLDPAADRLYIVSTLVALAAREIVPVWLVAVLLGRELVLGLLLLVLRRYGYPPLQVHYLGKAATLLLLYAFPVLLLADGDGRLAALAAPFAWALTIWGAVLYVLAGVFYAVQVAGIVRTERAARRAGTTP